MSRLINRLTPAKIATLRDRGRYPDGANLYLNVTAFGSKNWTFLFKDPAKGGRPREIGLGAFPAVTLAEARERASAYRAKMPTLKASAFQQAMTGIVPNVAAPATTAPVPFQAATAGPMTFGEFADRYVASKIEEFKNPIHRAQWESSLKNYAATLRPIPIADVDTNNILAVLRPIWNEKHETASRLRGRIERILAAAAVEGLRSGDNPARWVGHLKEAEGLNTRKGSDKKNHAALPYAEMPDFMGQLRKLTSVSAMALDFAILNAARTGEIIGAKWSEIDMAERVWIIPAERMKAGKEHRVPLNDRSIEILKKLRTFSKLGPNDAVFQNGAGGKPLSNMALLQCLKGLRAGATTHGMRSAFRDWAGDETRHDGETIEFALAHVKGDKAEAAYRRGTAFDKRRALLNDWQNFLGQTIVAKKCAAP